MKQVATKGLVLNPADLTVEVDGVVTPLTMKEWKLLYFLNQNTGKTVSRDEIRERFTDWRDACGAKNIIDVYVNYLRRKIGVDRIQTVRGEGYVLKEAA